MSYRQRDACLSVCCIALAMGALATRGFGEELLKKAGDEYLGWKISEKQFKTCDNTLIDIGSGRIEKTSRICSSTPPPGKEARWSGMIVRSDKEASSLTVRGRVTNVEKIVHYDSSTKWTTQEGKEVKAIEPSAVKDGDRVICLGSYDEKGEFHATRIDLRKPK